MKKSLLILLALSLSGCAGLDVEWQLSATYLSKDLIAKRQEARDQARADKLTDDAIAKALRGE